MRLDSFRPLRILAGFAAGALLSAFLVLAGCGQNGGGGNPPGGNDRVVVADMAIVRIADTGEWEYYKNVRLVNPGGGSNNPTKQPTDPGPGSEETTETQRFEVLEAEDILSGCWIYHVGVAYWIC